jgi:hypothetical protein
MLSRLILAGDVLSGIFVTSLSSFPVSLLEAGQSFCSAQVQMGPSPELTRVFSVPHPDMSSLCQHVIFVSGSTQAPACVPSPALQAAQTSARFGPALIAQTTGHAAAELRMMFAYCCAALPPRKVRVGACVVW